MTILLMFLTAYGITFGLMNDKVSFLTDRLKSLKFRVETTDEGTTTFFERMLVCPYCTGFHAGWLSWLLTRFPEQVFHVNTAKTVAVAISEVIASAFAASAVCYLLDVSAQLVEDMSSAAENRQDS